MIHTFGYRPISILTSRILRRALDGATFADLTDVVGKGSKQRVQALIDRAVKLDLLSRTLVAAHWEYVVTRRGRQALAAHGAAVEVWRATV